MLIGCCKPNPCILALQHTAGEDGFQATRTSEAPDNASSGTAAVATALTAFFSGLTLNLQGPELRCADIYLSST